MGATAWGLVANLIDWIEGSRSDHGRPRCPTQAVVETLRFFLREGVQWRELRLAAGRVYGGEAEPKPHVIERQQLCLPPAAPGGLGGMVSPANPGAPARPACNGIIGIFAQRPAPSVAAS